MPYLDKRGFIYLWNKIKAALTGKQDILTGGATGQFLSKASDADGDIQWVDPPTGGDSAGEVYSTEETVIGTWIDGSPIYRRVVEGVTPSAYGADVDEPITDLFDDVRIIRLYGVVYDDNHMYPVPNIINSASIGLSCSSGRNRQITCHITGTGEFSEKQIFVIMEYIY